MGESLLLVYPLVGTFLDYFKLVFHVRWLEEYSIGKVLYIRHLVQVSLIHSTSEMEENNSRNIK